MVSNIFVFHKNHNWPLCPAYQLVYVDLVDLQLMSDTDRRTDRQTDRQTDRDGQTDGRTYGNAISIAEHLLRNAHKKVDGRASVLQQDRKPTEVRSS